MNIAEDLEDATRQCFIVVDSEEVAMNQAGASEFEDVDLTNWEEIPEQWIENEFDKKSLTTEESIMIDDEENIEEVESFTHGSVTLKARDDTVMQEVNENEDQPEKEAEKEEKQAGRPVEKSKGSVPTRPKEASKTNQAAEKLQKATEIAEDRIWLDPEDLGHRIPFKNVNNSGRLFQISKKLSYFLRSPA